MFRAPFLWLRQRGENFFYKFLNYFDWHDKRLFQFRTKIVDSIISRCPIYRDSDSMRRATHCKYIRLHITEMKKSFFFLFVIHALFCIEFVIIITFFPSYFDSFAYYFFEYMLIVRPNRMEKKNIFFPNEMNNRHSCWWKNATL